MFESIKGFLLPIFTTGTGVVGLTIDDIHTGLSIGVIVLLGIPAGVLAILVHIKQLKAE